MPRPEFGRRGRVCAEAKGNLGERCGHGVRCPGRLEPPGRGPEAGRIPDRKGRRGFQWG